MDRSAKTAILVLFVVVGFASATCFHYVQGAYLGQAYPKNTFLFDPAFYGSDFEDVVRDGHTLDPYLGYSSAQYPFLALIGYAFSLLPMDSYAIFLTITSLAFLMLTAAYIRTNSWPTMAADAFALSFLSYPFLFAADRGNFELLVMLFLLAFAWFFTRKQHIPAGVMLSFAIALKLFPAIFLILFLPERKYRAMLMSVACAGALTLGSLVLFHGGLAANASFLLHGSNLGSNWQFAQFTLLSSNTVQRGVSFLTLLKILSFETGVFQGSDPFRFLGHYVTAAALVGSLLVVYVWVRERVLWKQAAVLTFAMLLLPHISADYKLLHVFIPLYLFVNSEARSKLDGLYLSLFGLLLIPKDYYWFSRVISDASGAHDVSIAVPVNIIILIAFTLLIVISGMVRRSPTAGTEASSAPLLEGHSEVISP